MKKLTPLITLFLLLSNTVLADCTYNGKNYSEGTVIGPYVCRDGKWENT